MSDPNDPGPGEHYADWRRRVGEVAPYRAAPRTPSPWLLRLDRWLPLRGFAWFRRRIGGVWVHLWAHLMPGSGCEWWHREGIDPPVRVTCKALKREVYL